MVRNKNAFTLVELLVVITIITILAVIVFIITTSNLKDSRDAVKMADLSTLEEGLKIYHIDSGKYPKPSNSLEVNYTGGILFYQGTFGENPYSNLGSLSVKPIDPYYENEYDYSVSNNFNKYQLSTIFEGDRFTYLNVFPQANAFLDNENRAYVTGNYGIYDLLARVNDNCYLITIPSLFIGESNFSGSLEKITNYNFVYNKSRNITNNYQTKLNINTSFENFQINEVYDKCSITSVDEFNLYVSKLSLAYQQMIGISEFDKVIYDFNILSFRQGLIDILLSNGISISHNVVTEINNPNGGNIYKDTFSGTDNTELIGGHTPDSFGSWEESGALVSSSYTISGNTLTKNDNLSGVIKPIPVLPINSIDRTILLNIVDTAGGSIFIYSNYVDEDNYYGIELTNAGYTIIHKVGGIQSSPYPLNLSDPISPNSQIEFSIKGNNIKLTINGIEKENLVDFSASFLGNPAINMTSQNSVIDNFTLIYK